MAMTVLLTGTNREVNAVARRINQIHQSVHGTLTHSIGQYHIGEPYSAMDISPLLWVHVSFVEGMLTAYRNFVGPLSEIECEQYWQESCRDARRLGLTEATLPASYRAMEAYRDRAISHRRSHRRRRSKTHRPHDPLPTFALAASADLGRGASHRRRATPSSYSRRVWPQVDLEAAKRVLVHQQRLPSAALSPCQASWVGPCW